MSGYSFDTNIIIDALVGHGPAIDEMERAFAIFSRVSISRLVWLEVMSKGSEAQLRNAERMLSSFEVDEFNAEIAERAAALRRERTRLTAMDAAIFATALVNGRVLVTRNTKDFPANMPGIRVPYIL